MRAAHAVWVAAPNGDVGGELLLWAEKIEADGRPSVVALGPLRELLEGLRLAGQLVPMGATLLLPSVGGLVLGSMGSASPVAAFEGPSPPDPLSRARARGDVIREGVTKDGAAAREGSAMSEASGSSAPRAAGGAATSGGA